MNRSFHAFAVLLVSLAGGMIAATWTSTLPSNRPAMHAKASSKAVSPHLHCSCNPESLVRLEEGCARDKTTGDVYGCELAFGKGGTNRKSGLSRGANAATNSLARTAVMVGQGISEFPWTKLAVQAKRLENQLAAMEQYRPNLNSKPQHELDYAAAELAAAGFEPSQGAAPWLKMNQRVAPLYQVISADEIRGITKSTSSLLGSIYVKYERTTRLWLVESGLHQKWDAAEEAIAKEQLLAGALLKIDDESIDRWFENFPPPVTVPNRLINPLEVSPDEENSRRIILATAKALESLSELIHQTAENLARHAEQDVAKLHKLKSGLEERR